MTSIGDDETVVVEVKKGDETMASRVPAALRTRLGDDATFGLIELLDSERKDWSEQVLSVAADRFERRLTVEMAALRQEIATSRVEWLRWSFVFGIGQVAAMAALMSMMLRP